MRYLLIKVKVRLVVLTSVIASLLVVGAMIGTTAPVFAMSSKVTGATIASTKMGRTAAVKPEVKRLCGSKKGDAVDYWYCWDEEKVGNGEEEDQSSGYQYDVWEKHVDVACWSHRTGFAQAGTGPAHADLADEDGPPTPQCP